MCGILGIIGNQPVAQDIYDGLIVLQHRGQDSAGIMTYDDHFHLKKGNGLVRDVFHTKNMMRLKGAIGIGHVRYPTAGSYDASEAQPFYVNAPYGLAIIHNGNLTNYDTLQKEMAQKRHLNTKSDSEILLNVVADEISKLRAKTFTPEILFKAMNGVFKRVCGSYSAIVLVAGFGMFAFRDPYGIRPLVFGSKNLGSLLPEYLFASESVSVSSLGFKLLGDVEPGEVVYIDPKRNLHRKICGKPARRSPCIFEYVYLARPDSILDGVSVYKTRLRMGTFLAKQIKAAKLKIDVVIPVPDSARSVALSLADVLHLPYREGLVKNRYIGRTFIMPGQGIRKKSIRYKLNPIELEIRGKNILLVDDSIVRGNTSKKIIDMVRAVGAKKVYFASSAPPLRFPCVYGVDMPSKKEFIAHTLTTNEIAQAIGADRLFYQTLPDLLESARRGNPKMKTFCSACMDGKYPTHDVNEKLLARVELSREEYRKQDVTEHGDDVTPEEQLTLL